MQKTGEICRLLRENGNDIAVFDTHSLGLYTGRDPYAYNFSKDELREHMLREKQTYKEEKVYPAFYRPFVPMWVYFDEVFNSSISHLSSIFPTPDTENLAIAVSGKGSDWFDAFITDRIVDYGFMYNTQIFPLYIYTETFQKQYNISDNTLILFQKALKDLTNTKKDPTITKEDIFFYVFGLLSTPFCVKRFRNSLNKELPTVPILKRRFREISRLGRQLAGVQLAYQRYVWAVVMREEREEVPEYSDLTVVADENALKEYVERVKLDEENREILINEKVKVRGIPEFALECKIGNCSPIKWVSRYLVRQEDKETGVVWNPKLRVAEFVDIVRKLIAFSWMCLKIKQKLEELYFTSDKIREEEKILNEVFNLDFHEFLDEYTDKGSGKMPDFYLWSKEEGLPDLAIEVKTLQRDKYRILEENSLDNALKKIQSAVLEHSLSIGNLHIVLRLSIPFSVGMPPGPVEGTWNNLKKELDKYKEKWEYILGRINEIENILENEDQEKYVKDLSHQKKEQLKKIIDDIKRQDEEFLKGLPYVLYLCLGKEIETCAERVGNVKTIIQISKEKWIKQRIKGFVEAFFYKERGEYLSKKPDREGWKPSISEVASENGYTLDILFLFHYRDEEEIAFHIKKIKEYIEESIGKFDTLRKQKFKKSDHSRHLELLLVKGETFLDPSFNSLIEEIEKWLKKNGYDYLLFPIKQEAEEEILGAGEAVYYLIIRMDGGTGISVEDDWKTQIREILKLHEKPDCSIANALDNPEKFAEEVDKLIEAYPLCLKRLIRDLRAALKQCTSGKALKLIKEIVKNSNKKDMLLGIAELLRDAFKENLKLLNAFEENLIPVDYKDELWEVIDGILNKLDKLEIGEEIPLKDICCHYVYGSIIFNNLEGSAIACLILYPCWLKKNNKIKDLNSIPEVKGKLEFYLNKEPSIIIHAVYGFYLHALLYTDEHWTKDMIPKIFPIDRVEQFWAAWCAYVQAGYQPCDDQHHKAYSLLREIYCHAIENMKYLECVKYMEDMNYLKCYEALIHHLADLYGRGIISLDDRIFRKFWEKANDDVREEFISYVGQEILVAEIRGDVIERFKELWEWRMNYIKDLSNRQDFQKELKSFIHWFVSRKFDTEWALDNLIKTVELADEITDEHVYLALDVLLEMANEFPELVLKYIDLLTHNASERILNSYKRKIRKSIEEISKILEAKGRSDLEKELKKIKETINLKLGREVFSD